jgi:predicted dehydrogenase
MMIKNIAVVGFGFMGMTHTMNILKNPGLKLTTIVDKNPEHILKNLGAQGGNFSTGSISAEALSSIRIYTELSDCLKAEKSDAVVIAVHTDLHFPLAEMALEAGADVFLEKPFCLDISQGEKLIATAKERNRILMIGHVVRFMPAYLTLKKWIEEKPYGDLEFLSLSRFSGLPKWGQWKEKQQDFGSSGGALFDLVIHDIDFAQWACGKPDRIESTILPGKLSRYDYVSAFWKYREADLVVKIEGGNTFHSEYPFQAAFSARFEKASVLFSCKDPDHIIVTTDTETTLVPSGNAMDGFSGEMDYFADCMVNNRFPLHCTPESALDAVKICLRHLPDQIIG